MTNENLANDSIVIVDYEVTCGAGVGLEDFRAALKTQNSGLIRNDLPHSGLPTWIGKINSLDCSLQDPTQWSDDLIKWKSRNNALIRLALDQGSLRRSLNFFQQQVAPSRIGIIVGSSTSSIDRSEEAYRQKAADENCLPANYRQPLVLNPHAPGLFAAHYLNLSGPNMTISTACSSSAKVFASAARWLNTGLVDVVLVGGADTLCLSVLHGFHSLQLVSENPCKPFDSQRDGINLGEGAGFAILARASDVQEHKGIAISGHGESSDAHHMSHPHPEGEGARLAIDKALQCAQLTANDIGYINLHGTASRANDNIEGNLIGKMFPTSTLASSTKGWTGHTLGAAGIVEAIVAMDSLCTGLIPGTLNLNDLDPEISVHLQVENTQADIKHAMSNSFGFGGNNAALIFSRV